MRISFIFLFTIIIATGFSQQLPKESWKIVYVDSEEPKEEVPNSGLATAVIDNNLASFWTTKIGQGDASFPHTLVIDFGAVVKTNTFRIYPRQNRDKGKIAAYTLSIGDQLNNMKLVYTGKMNFSSPQDWKVRTVRLASYVQGRYLKFVALKPVIENDVCIHLAEIEVDGKYISPIIIPQMGASTRLANTNESIAFADKTRCWNTEIVAWEWKFPGATPSKSYDKNPSIHYQHYGKYAVTLTVTTKQGLKQSIVDSSMIAILPAPEFPRNNWLLSVSDQEIAHDETAAKMMDNNPLTHWHTSWFVTKKLPHYILMDLGYRYKVSGIGYLPRQTGTANGIFSTYRIYISNDTSSVGELVASVNEAKVYRSMRYVTFKPTDGRYVKIVIDKTFPSGSNFASAAEIYVYAAKEPVTSYSWIIPIVLLLLFVAAVLFWWLRRKNRTKSIPQLSVIPTEISTTKKVNVYFFGKFLILNEEQPIEQFFNKIKQIFVVIAYHTFENDGITTTDFSRMLWPDLPEVNISSARSSNIKKLRFALESVPSLRIVINKKSWQLELDEEEVFIDYKAYIELTARLHQMFDNQNLNIALLQSYLSIVERGRFLEEFETEWADDIKSAVSEDIIQLLKNCVSNFSTKLPSSIKSRIADALFIQDELSIDALKLKLQLYQKEANLGLAKKLYESYARKYKMMYDEEFKTQLTDLLHS